MKPVSFLHVRRRVSSTAVPSVRVRSTAGPCVDPGRGRVPDAGGVRAAIGGPGWRGRADPTTGARTPDPRARRSPRWPTAIAGSEPVTVAAHPDDVDGARRTRRSGGRGGRDRGRRRVDARHRPDVRRRRRRGSLRGVDWRFNAWGGDRRRAVRVVGPRRRDGRRSVLRAERVDRYRAPIVARGRRDPCRRRGHAARHRGVSPQSRTATPSSTAPRSKPCCATYTRRGAHHLARPGGRRRRDRRPRRQPRVASCAPAWSLLTWTDDRTDPQYERQPDARRRLERRGDARGPFARGRAAPPARAAVRRRPRRPRASRPAPGTPAAPRPATGSPRRT